jgi:hypothetical protein
VAAEDTLYSECWNAPGKRRVSEREWMWGREEGGWFWVVTDAQWEKVREGGREKEREREREIGGRGEREGGREGECSTKQGKYSNLVCPYIIVFSKAGPSASITTNSTKSSRYACPSAVSK